MLTVKATATMRYADKRPYDPQHELIKGMIYNSRDIPILILKRAVGLGYAEEVESDLEIPVEDELEVIEEVAAPVSEKTLPKVKNKRRRG